VDKISRQEAAREKRGKERALFERLAEDEDFMAFLADVELKVNNQIRLYMLSAPSTYDQRDLVYMSGQLSVIESMKQHLNRERKNG
jgi:hypothetical protein